MSRFGLLYFACVLVLTAVACARTTPATTSAPAQPLDSQVVVNPPPISITATIPAVGLDTAKWVDSTLASLSLRERVGQMVWFWTLGDYTAVDDSTFAEALGWIEKDGVGGLSMSLGTPIEVAAKLYF